jgi:hypothetical protein
MSALKGACSRIAAARSDMPQLFNRQTRVIGWVLLAVTGVAIAAARTQGQRLWRRLQAQLLIEAILVAAACFITWLMRSWVELRPH